MDKKKTTPNKSISVSSFLRTLSVFQQKRIQKMRSLIKSMYLNVQEQIFSESLLFFMPEELNKKFHHRRLIFIKPFLSHINIAVPFHLSKFQNELKGYKLTPKGMLQIQDDQSLPIELLKKIFEECLVEQPSHDRKAVITLETIVHQPVSSVWNYWTKPNHITQWYFAASSWQAPRATNQLKVGGSFLIRMEAKDGSEGFDFTGFHEVIEPLRLLKSKLADGRMWQVTFKRAGKSTRITESFEAEGVNSIELQREGWKAILENFKHYAESKK